MSLASVAVVLCVAMRFATAFCPTNFDSVSPDKCIKVITEAQTYCFAQKMCFENGARLIEGTHWFPILSNTSRSSAVWGKINSDQIWIGLTDLFEERGRKQSGWQWTSEQRVLARNVPWKEGSPNHDPNHDCTVYRKGEGVIDSSCQSKNQYICEPFSPLKHPTEFAPASLLPAAPGGFSEMYCGSNPRIAELFDCIVHCHEDKYACKGFYHNSDEKNCRILWFKMVSSNLMNAPWKKFKAVWK